tara:strand:+ start:215 stop:574 length:360 start_codon:yes stop_codon:yes gene_type:complete
VIDPDPITALSQLADNQGLDAPNPFPDIPDPPPGFNPEEHPLFDVKVASPSTKSSAKFVPHVKVFVVTEKGNDEYEELLALAANGEIMLGRKDVGDIKGAPAYKVYQEWLVPVKPKTKK